MGTSSTNLAMTDLAPKNHFTNLTKPLGPFKTVALLRHSVTEMYRCFLLFFFLSFFFLCPLIACLPAFFFTSFHFAFCAELVFFPSNYLFNFASCNTWCTVK